MRADRWTHYIKSQEEGRHVSNPWLDDPASTRALETQSEKEASQ